MVHGIEGLAQVNESQDAAEAIGSNTFKKATEGYYLPYSGYLMSKNILAGFEQRV